MLIKILSGTMGKTADGEIKRLNAGEVVDVDDIEARHLIAWKHAEVAEDSGAKKRAQKRIKPDEETAPETEDSKLNTKAAAALIKGT